MDIPSLFMIPSAVSSGKVHSVFPNSTDADFDFNRDSDATRVNSEGLIERVGFYSAERVTNGDFSSGSSNWNIQAGTVIFSNNAVELQGASIINQSGVASPSSSTYKVTYTIKSTSGSPVLKLYNGSWFTVNSTVGTHTISFVPNSVTFYLRNDSTGNITIDNVSVKEIQGDRARLNYEIEGGLVNTKPSLLLEPSRTNFVNSSENANGWSAIDSNITKTDNAIISPDGLNNGTKLESLTNSSANQIVNFGTTSLSGVNVVGKTYTGSVYIKPVYSSDVGKKVTFSIQRIAGDFEGLSVTFTIDSADWKRYEMTFTYTGTGAGNQTGSNFKILKASTTIDDVYIWGVMLEEGSYPTSYIPTNGSAQTRAAETCNGAGTSSILPSEEGILYVEAKALVNGGDNREITITSGASTNIIRLRYSSDVSRFQAFMRSGGGTIQSLSRTAKPQDVYRKIAIEYNSTEFAMWIDGTKEATVTTTSTPIGLNELEFELGGASFFYGKIRDIRVYNTKEMTDSEVDILLTKITS